MRAFQCLIDSVPTFDSFSCFLLIFFRQPGSSEAAVIQAEYAAVDAREKAKLDADEAQRTRAPVRVRLAPATASLRMPSEG